MLALVTFAKTEQRRSGVQCFVCSLEAPIRDEIAAARESATPISFTTISKWLANEHGIKIGDAALAAHFRKGHD